MKTTHIVLYAFEAYSYILWNDAENTQWEFRNEWMDVSMICINIVFWACFLYAHITPLLWWSCYKKTTKGAVKLNICICDMIWMNSKYKYRVEAQYDVLMECIANFDLSILILSKSFKGTKHWAEKKVYIYLSSIQSLLLLRCQSNIAMHIKLFHLH